MRVRIHVKDAQENTMSDSTFGIVGEASLSDPYRIVLDLPTHPDARVTTQIAIDISFTEGE